MGQEIGKSTFEAGDFKQFLQRLETETGLLDAFCAAGCLSDKGPVGGFELEAWLTDAGMDPAPLNGAFLKRFSNSLASPELARFNVEFNTPPLRLERDFLAQGFTQIEATWRAASAVANDMGLHLLAIGILPTLTESCLNLSNLSDMRRYRALNEQVLTARAQRPIKLDIVGHQRLHCEHVDVMLEAATTSFQIHWQAPASRVAAAFNGALLMSAPLVALGANSPLLFGKDLWAETRIPLFEQAVSMGGYGAASAGPVKRVDFGTGYAKDSLLELFRENLDHHPVILPLCLDDPPERFAHLRLHNGTIWRWIRPLLGFDEDGTPHFRLEQRVLPAGPSLVDMVANAAFFFGSVTAAVAEDNTHKLPFAQIRDNFYLSAQHGLRAQVSWVDGQRHGMRSLLLRRLIPQAARGLEALGIDQTDIDRFLGVVERRVETGQTGSEWQRLFLAKCPGALVEMTRAYMAQQVEGIPVSEWRM